MSYKKIHESYIKKINIAITGSGHDVWTPIGHGTVKESVNQTGEFVIDVIIAPIVEQRVALEYVDVVSLPIGAIELFPLRKTWMKQSESPELFRATPKKNVIFYLTPSEYRVVELSELVEIPRGGNGLNKLQKIKYLVYKAYCGYTEYDFYVPCAEVLRFYYGSSSTFVQQCFKALEAEKCLYNASKTFKRMNQHFLTLKSHMYDIDSPFVARVAFDIYAKKCFERIHTDIFQNPRKNKDNNIICIPPIEDGCHWSVDGVYKEKGFFVTRINLCSGKFPFYNLSFGRDNDGRGKRTRPPKEIKVIEKKKPVLAKYQEEGNDKDGSSPKPPLLGDTSPPSTEVDPLFLEPDSVPEFSDLLDKKVDKVQKHYILNEDTMTLVKYVGVQIIEHCNTAKASGLFNKDTGKLNVVRRQEKYDSIFDIMFELKDELEDAEVGSSSVDYYRGIVHSALNITTVVPIDLDKIKLHLSFCIPPGEDEYDTSESSVHRRPMALFYITYKSIDFYFLEFLSENALGHAEHSSLLFSCNEGTDKDLLIEEQIALFSKHGRQYRKEALVESGENKIFVHRFTHPKESKLEDRVRYIIQRLEKGYKFFRHDNS